MYLTNPPAGMLFSAGEGLVSEGCGPASISNMAAASLTVLPKTPSVSRKYPCNGNTPDDGIVPNVGLMPTTEAADDGLVMDEPVSSAVASAAIPEATATPDPPLDPPGVRSTL